MLAEPEEDHRNKETEREGKPDEPTLAQRLEGQHHAHDNRGDERDGHRDHEDAEKDRGKAIRRLRRVDLINVDGAEAGRKVVRFAHALVAAQSDGLIPASGDVEQEQRREKAAEEQVEATENFQGRQAGAGLRPDEAR